MSIAIRDLNKSFGSNHVLRDINLDVEPGELLALLGPSGCGKTTLLRLIAGLEYADSGTIAIAGVDASAMPVRERKVGFVFQHYALFRHMTVFENIAFGLRVRPRSERPEDNQIRDTVNSLLDRVQLEGLGHRFPAQLSGGQRQRVALARALAVNPRVLLLDEPFGALDAKVRKDLRRWLRRLHDELRVTSVFVTHDQDEALELADRVVLMNAGRIEQIGTPEQVWRHPSNPFVFGFIGDVNVLNGTLAEGGIRIGEALLEIPGQAHPNGAAGQAASAYIRPDEFEILPRTGGARGLPVKVERVIGLGSLARLELLPQFGQASGVISTIEVTVPFDQLQEEQVSIGSEVLIRATRGAIFAS